MPMPRLLLVVLLLPALAWAHGGAAPPPPPRPTPVTPGLTPPSTPPPTTPPTTPHDPTTPGEPPRGPETPGEQPGPSVPTPDDLLRTRGRRAAEDQSWRVWWEFNREHLVGFRHLLHGTGTITGTRVDTAPDALGELRPEVLIALRTLAQSHGADPTLRSAALIALGRMGDDDDAELMLALLSGKQPSDVHEGAALGLGMLPAFENDAVRLAVRERLLALLKNRRALPARARAFAIIAAGLRARGDPPLVMALAQDAARGGATAEDAASLALAAGLAGERMLTPELLDAARTGRFGTRKLNDIARSHATQGLALVGDPVATRTLTALARSRRAGVHTRRSAVLALGRLLREGAPGDDDREDIEATLRKVFDKNGDPVLRGFAALALGGAKPPAHVRALEKAVDKGGNAALKPWAALALGLAARGGDDDRANAKVRAFLARELAKTRQHELESALCIAVGLAGAEEALEPLLDRVALTRKAAALRGYAAQGVGLLGLDSARAHEVLLAAMRSGKPELLGDAALALGMLGRRGAVPELLKILRGTEAEREQGRVILALGHLGHGGAAEPLLQILDDATEKQILREFAAVALGLLGDRRKVDVLFAIDADFNYFATTTATNELIRLY